MKGGGLSRFEEARQEKFKRYKSLRYSSFNRTQPREGSFNLIDIVGDEEKEEAHARRPMGRNIWKNNDAKIPMDPGTKLVKVEDGNSVDATYYRSLIGSLRYLLHTRPDVSYSVGLLSRFMQDPKDHHLNANHLLPTVALSSCESEFIAATGAACQALWLKRLLSELTGWEEKRITVKWRTTKSRYLNESSTKIEVRDYATNARSSRLRTKQRSRLRRRM
ncbi:ribonuclease H-like domain, reverse transcriptase, RNA-dependent DNA polymerase [Tanacetum coccineum]